MSPELFRILLEERQATRIIKNSHLEHEVMTLTEHCDVSLVERIWLLKNGLSAPPSCPNGSAKKWVDGNVGYRFCGRATVCACAKDNHSKKISASKKAMSSEDVASANDKRKETVQSRYGVDHISQEQKFRDKVEETCLAKYGVKSNLATVDTKNKIRETNLVRYGTEHPMQSKEVSSRSKATFLARHGSPAAMARESMMAKHGVCHALQKMEFRNKLVDTKAKRFGYSEETVSLIKNDQSFISEWETIGVSGMLEKYDLSSGAIHHHLNRLGLVVDRTLTAPERIVAEILENLGLKYQTNDRTIIKPFELDFYVPDYKLAIEVCGLYWHGERAGRDRNYHLDKHERCQSAGVRLITIFDDELDKIDIVRAKLRHAFGLGDRVCSARQTIIRPIDSSTAKKFLEKYHVQAACRSSVKLGAFFQSELVAVMTFGNRRHALGGRSAPGEWELLRMASMGSIPGIASKLFSNFLRTHDPKTVISYCDSRWGTGNVYKQLGMIEGQKTSPGYWYVPKGDGRARLHRYLFAKHKLVEAGHPASMTEKEIMQSLGYDRIWDCGNTKWVWNK